MADLFVSYSRADRQPVSKLAGALQTDGHEVWWDDRLRAYQDFGAEIEASLRRSSCAIVAWSAAARDSLWVRAEATAAWESRKLVQLSLDGARPPLPFTMVHLLDFSKGDLTTGPSWEALCAAIDEVIQGKGVLITPAVAGGIQLAGFGRAAVIGAASLALVIVAAGLVATAANGQLSASLFGVLTTGMFLAALLAFARLLSRVIAVALATR
jgi:adenylate cyclase